MGTRVLLEYLYCVTELIIFVIVECSYSMYQCVFRTVFTQLMGQKSLQWTQRFLIHCLSSKNWIRTKTWKRNAIISVHGKKTLKFSFYIFILGTLILILDSYTPQIQEVHFGYEEAFLLCHFRQIHLPKQAIEIARLDSHNNERYLFREYLTYKSKKYAIHFLFRDTDKSSYRTRKI